MLLAIFAAIAWSVIAGLFAWALLSPPRPRALTAVASGALGWVVGFAAESAGVHVLHPFRPESLLPATGVALAVLVLARHVSEGREARRTIFF